MSLSELSKISYLKAAFKNIDENKPTEVYTARADRLGYEFKNALNENEIKRSEWFFLLRCINDCIQYESEDSEEQGKIFNDLKNHPYFPYYRGKNFVLHLFEHRKTFQDLLKNIDPEIAQIYFGLFHLHPDVRGSALRKFDDMLGSQEDCIKLSAVIKNIKLKLPLLFEEYSDMFLYCMAKANESHEIEKIGFFKKIFKDQTLVVLFVFIIAAIIYFTILYFSI